VNFGRYCANDRDQAVERQWATTRTQHLYRHNASGRYYVRAYRQGKEVWKSLGTTSYEVAKASAPRILAEINKARVLSHALLAGKPTVGDAAEIYRVHVATDVQVKESTKDYREETIRALFRSWPGLKQARLSLS
jgi:hypothetical protein